MKLLHPSLYEKANWHYKHANIDLIKKAIDNFGWKKKYCDPEQQTNILSDTIFNTMSNFIPYGNILIDDRDLS